MKDIFVPTSSADDALVKQLHTVTYVTAQPTAVDAMLERGYGLTATPSIGSDHPDAGAMAKYLGLGPADPWSVCAYRKAGQGNNVQLRVLSVDEGKPQIRSGHSGHDLGGVTISFPIDDLAAHEQVMLGLGVESTIGVKEMEFASPDGQTYISAEILYKAPENVLLLGVKRPDIFIPVGPIDPATGLGGPAYSARNVADADAMIAMLETVMGFEIRRDATFTIGERSGLGLPEGAKERFIQAFAPGARSGYLVLMDHFQQSRPSSAAQAIPNRGIVMWSFETRDLDEVHRRALAFGLKILQPPSPSVSPWLDADRTALVEDKEGFQMEFFQR